MSLLLRRWRYYALSVVTIIRGMRGLPSVIATFLGRPVPQGGLLVTLREGSRFLVRSVMDIWMLKEVCLDHDYERHGVAIEDGWVVLDVGAGIGEFAVSVARRHPAAQVYAFEPNPASYAVLQQNIALNHLTNCHTFPYAIGGAATARRLDTGAVDAVRHSMVTAVVGDGVQVSTLTLAQVLEGQGIARCDFLKMDCEGAEYEIFFQTPVDILHNVTHVCLEHHDDITPYQGSDLAAFLSDHGFQVRQWPNLAHRHIGFLTASRPVSPHSPLLKQDNS